MGRTLQSVGSGLIGVGRTLTIAVTAPILAMGTAALTAGINFEDAFAGIGKTVDGIMTSTGDLTVVGERVREQFRDLALEIPLTTNEIAALGEVVGQLGVQAEDVAEVTEIIAQLGATTELSAEDAAKGLIRFGNILNELGDNGENTADFLRSAGSAIVALGNASVSTEGEILELGLRLAAAGERANFSAQEILAWATTLSDLGVRAEAGGSAVSRAINEMLLAINTGSDNLATFADAADTSIDKFVKAFEEDASSALSTFIGKLKEGIEDGSVTIEMLNDMGLAGIRATDILGRLGNAEELFAKNLEIANKAWAEQIALQEEFNKRAATVKSQIQLLKNAFTDLGITIFDLVKDDLIALMEGIKNLIKDFKNLDPSIQKAIIQFALIAAAVGPVLIVVGSIISALGLFISGLAAIASPAGLAAGGILLLVGALAAIALPNLAGILGDLESIKEKALEVGRVLGFVVDVAVPSGAPNATQADQSANDGATETTPTFQMPSFATFIQGLKDLGGADIESVIRSIDRIGESFGRIFEKIAESPVVAQNLKNLGKSLSNIGETLKDFAIDRLDAFSDWLVRNEDELGEVGIFLTSVASALGLVGEAVATIGTAIAGGALDALGASLTLLLEIITGDFDVSDLETFGLELKDAAQNIGEAIADIGTALGGSDRATFELTWEGNFENIGIIFDTWKEGFLSSWAGVFDNAGVIFNAWWEGFKSSWTGVWDNLTTIVETWETGLDTTIDGLVTNIGLILEQLPIKAATIMSNFVANISAGFAIAVSDAQTKATEMLVVGVLFIQNAITGAASLIGTFVGNVTSGFASAVAGAAGFIGSMLAVGSSLIQAAIAGIASKVGSLISNARSAIQSALDAASAAAGRAAAIGSAMVAGIAGAIAGGASAIIGALVDAVMAGINAAMAAAGIASPSKVTMGMGEEMIKGLVLGLETEGGEAAGANAVNSILNSMQALLGTNMPATSIVNNSAKNFNIGDITGVPITSEDSLAALLQERLAMAT